MQLEADAKLAEEMQREEEAAQARASRLLAYGDVAVGSNVMEGILEKKPVRGFGRFLGGDFKRRRIVLRRTGSPCFAIIEWHHGDGDDTGGGHRWMPLGPTETRVREGGAAGDDATRCLTVVGEEGEELVLQAGDAAERDAWVRETARLLHTLKAAAFDDACKWARSRLDALGDAPPSAAAREGVQLLFERFYAATAVTPREDEASLHEEHEMLLDGAAGCVLPPQAAERLQAGVRRQPSADERREQGLFAWQPETIEHVEGAAWQLVHALASADAESERAPMPTVASGEALPELESGAPAASPAAAPAAAPEGDESSAAAPGRDGAVSIDGGREVESRLPARMSVEELSVRSDELERDLALLRTADPETEEDEPAAPLTEAARAATEIMPPRPDEPADSDSASDDDGGGEDDGAAAAALQRAASAPVVLPQTSSRYVYYADPVEARRQSGVAASPAAAPAAAAAATPSTGAGASTTSSTRPAAMSGEDSPLPLIDPISSPGGWRYSRQVMKVAGDLAAPAAALDHCLGISGPFVFSQAPADAQPERWLTFRSAVPRRVVRRIVSLALAMPPALGAVGAHLSAQYDQLR